MWLFSTGTQLSVKNVLVTGSQHAAITAQHFMTVCTLSQHHTMSYFRLYLFYTFQQHNNCEKYLTFTGYIPISTQPLLTNHRTDYNLIKSVSSVNNEIAQPYTVTILQ